MDIFTRTIRGIRLKYAAVSVVFLVVAVTLFYLGGPRVFGWYDFFAVFTLVLMVLTLFLLQSHYVLGPIEKLSDAVNTQRVKAQSAAETLRIPWNGKDEFACLAAAFNELLETVQNRSLGLAEENRRLKEVIAGADLEIVLMNANKTVLSVIHRPDDQPPVPGLVRGCPPDPSVWSEENRRAFSAAFAAACECKGSKSADLAFSLEEGRKTRRIRAVIKRQNPNSFPVVAFSDLLTAPAAPTAEVRKVPLSRIAAGVSRDLQKVFAVIRKSAERYADSSEPEVREMVATVKDAIRSGMTMMERLLILGGGLRMDLRPIGVRDLIAALKSAVDEETGNNCVRVEYGIADGSTMLTVDVRQLRQVVANVVRNSVEAFGAIPGRIAISSKVVTLQPEVGAAFYPPQPAERGVLISIEDDGPGMAENVLAHAFEPYTSTKSSGRGLGLAVAASIVEAHGGGMRLASKKGVSTTVDIFLRTSSHVEGETLMVQKDFPAGEVLVVDDNRSVLKITAALLRTQKIAAHVAENRAEALLKFSALAHRIRAVFLDAQLGDETSVGVLQNMRDLDPKVPVIVVSGYTKDEVDAMFVEAPPDGFLMKPYSVSELKAQLDNVSGTQS